MSDQSILPEHFINRELSWLEFNARVLEEARDATNPLLERLKFLSIFSSNLDEFFMVRVAGLREQAFGAMAPQDPPSDGLSPLAQLQRISFHTRPLVDDCYACWRDSVQPALVEQGIRLLRESELSNEERTSLDEYFRQRVFPVLTPMAIDPSHPSPRFHNRGLYLAVTLNRSRGIGPRRMYAVVQLPLVLPRFVPVGHEDQHTFLFLEDLVAARLPELFGGYEISHCGAFRITRDMDIDLLDEEGDDMLRAIESRLRARQRSEAVRLEVSSDMPADLLEMVTTQESIRQGVGDSQHSYNEVYSIDGPLDLSCLMDLTSAIDRPDLRDPVLTARTPPQLSEERDLFTEIAEQDVLLHHPFDSFRPVVRFVEQAARDPNVLAIKQTLYRTSGDSPIVNALIDAAESGKHVTALVELKARFDEANNISWARRMERAGVHVVFGFMDLKTHCKLALVVRQEGSEVRRYAHLGTGNYNPTTARLYTDLGLFTANAAMTEDVSALFNFLTGYSQSHPWAKLVVAPQDLHRRTIELIDEQAERAQRGKKAKIFAKLNALVDRRVIAALYRASQAGVPIDLVIRGVCSLRPGMPGLSESIRVRSIVDRFLEHSRIMTFGEGDKERVYLSSADWMPRNFERRVEVMFPIEHAESRRRIIEEIIPIYLSDNQRARILSSDGAYVRAEPHENDPPRRSQQELLDIAVGRAMPPAPSPLSTPAEPVSAPTPKSEGGAAQTKPESGNGAAAKQKRKQRPSKR